jgi:membrane protease YdiL (CAAX protease family)
VDKIEPGAENHVDLRLLRGEIVIVLLVTFGSSGLSAALSLVQTALSPGGLTRHTVALNPVERLWPIDLLAQLLDALSLAAWAALGLYLLRRSGIGAARIGLSQPDRRDVGGGLALATVIGIPGLGLYLAAHRLGLNVTVVPGSLGGHWWRPITLVISAIANAAAEEIVVVGYLLERLGRLGWSRNRALAASALLRGSYHLYQGVGEAAGNLVMGLVFGRLWQRTNRLWPLIAAHALMDSVAFVGYPLLHNSVSWLP